MKTSSAKNKGRRLQQWVVQMLVDYLDVDPKDVESRPMGSGGVDVIMGVQTQAIFPYAVECKNVEKLNVWGAYDQAEANCEGMVPLVIMKKNGRKPLAVVDAEHFFDLQSIINTTNLGDVFK